MIKYFVVYRYAGTYGRIMITAEKSIHDIKRIEEIEQAIEWNHGHKNVVIIGWQRFEEEHDTSKSK